jgi:hypothetical protein
MTISLRHFAFVLFATLCSPAVTAYEQTFEEKARHFADDRYRDLRLLIDGKEPVPQPNIAPELSCTALYQRRVALQNQLNDYKPPYWSDARNQTAVFLGTIWTPAFYFLGYSAITGYLDEMHQIDPQSEIDALRQASAAQRCFER